MNQEDVTVNQAMPHQRLKQAAATEDDEVETGLLLELRDGLGRFTRQQRGVLPWQAAPAASSTPRISESG